MQEVQPNLEPVPYTLIDSNGRVLMTGKTLTIPERNDATVIHEEAPSLTHYRQAGTWVEQPPQPSPHHIFDYTTKQWVDPRTLSDLQAAQWTQIKQARTQAEYAGFTWDGSAFDSDAISQQRITGAVALAQMSDQFSIGWVLKDNTVRTLNQTDMMQVGAALGQHVAAQFAKGVLLREQIEAAATKEEVEAVVW